MKSSRRLRAAAFTLAEVVVAIGIFGITSAASIGALLRMNVNAALCRLQTGACTVAQNQIDLALSDAPFNPQYHQVPPELTPGQGLTPLTTYTGSSTAPTVPVYTDPSSGQQVLGWMTTTVADTGATLNTNTLYVYRVTVIVSYFYKGRQYNVSLSTMRCADT